MGKGANNQYNFVSKFWQQTVTGKWILVPFCQKMNHLAFPFVGGDIQNIKHVK